MCRSTYISNANENFVNLYAVLSEYLILTNELLQKTLIIIDLMHLLHLNQPYSVRNVCIFVCYGVRCVTRISKYVF